MKEEVLSQVKKLLQEYSINTNDYSYQVNEIGDQVNNVQLYQVLCSNMLSNKNIKVEFLYQVEEHRVLKYSIVL